jgi:hypothetical protein
MRYPTLAALLFLVTVPTGVATADPFPHEFGRVWHYATAGGQHDKLVAGSPVSIPLRGRTAIAQPFAFDAGGVHAGWTEWLEFTADGSVNLVQTTDAGGVGFRYDPPLILFPSPLYYPAVPIVLFTNAQPLPSGAEVPIFYNLDVTIAPITVPFGTFTGISGTLRALAIAGTSDYVADIWADGVGCVQYHDGVDFQLESVDAPTPVMPVSWGGVKRLYR